VSKRIKGELKEETREEPGNKKIRRRRNPTEDQKEKERGKSQ